MLLTAALVHVAHISTGVVAVAVSAACATLAVAVAVSSATVAHMGRETKPIPTENNEAAENNIMSRRKQ